jgi:nickel-type superoxide dismutase maturation protease
MIYDRAGNAYGSSLAFLSSMGLPEINWRERTMFFLGRRRAFRVEGDSMLPTLKHGDRLLIDPRAPIAVGDIVTANHPYKKSVRIIKRIESIDPSSGRLILCGDNPASSTDSRSLGAIARSEIVGKVVCLIPS